MRTLTLAALVILTTSLAASADVLGARQANAMGHRAGKEEQVLLESLINRSIVNTAAQGRNEAVVNIGQYNRDAVLKVEARLRDRGYGVDHLVLPYLHLVW